LCCSAGCTHGTAAYRWCQPSTSCGAGCGCAGRRCSSACHQRALLRKTPA
jgi:hypothetical protein